MPSEEAGTQKRRSTRIVQAMPITVSGVDALGQPFKERTTTVMVNCHGCKYQSKHYVPKNNVVSLDIPRPEPSLPPRTVQGRVIWVQRPRAVRELFQIGLEFDTAGNVWGIAFPPEDWFPYPGDEPPAAPTAPAGGETPAPAFLGIPAGQPAASESKISLVPTAATPDAQLAAARQTAKIVAEAKEALEKTLHRSAQSAINEEMTVVRQQLDAQLHDAVERAIKLSMERVSESASKRLIQQATERTAAIVEQARKTNEESAAQLDVKIREAVDGAVRQAAQQAAEQATQQATAQNLKQAVEEAVERIVGQREAAMPSLGILSSPEAAKQHLETWKASLEDTAQTIRSRSLEQTEDDVTAARQRWHDQFEVTMTGALESIRERFAETSQAALAQTEQDMAQRQASLRESLDSALGQAQTKVDSFGAGLEQQRRATEKTRIEIEEAGRSTLEQARQKLVEMLSVQQEEAERRAEQALTQRIENLEPTLQKSAQRTMEAFSGEFQQTLAPRLDAARQTAAELDRTRDAASELQEKIRTQVERAFDQAAAIETTLREQAEKVSQQAAQAEAAVRERVHHASQLALEESLERFRQESGKLPAEFEQSCRAALARVEAELEQKSTEAQHDTYEALSKAADWYQKKAQTTMQSALEKAVEQSTASLRGRAAEISSLVASELDHYRRSYVQHSQAEIEDAAKEIVERERGRIAESAETAQATFSDAVDRVTGNSMRRFEDASQQALEKARSDLEYTRETSLTEFQKTLDERVAQGVEQAQILLQSQLGPVVEAWEAKHQQQQREWLEQVKKSADESIEQYKTRLENASNSWLLASATTLGQHSQAVLDTLAKSAEKRMRAAIAEVLAGMGDTLKSRLLGISTNFSAEDDEGVPPKKK
ncbi:MAG TPA: hypothetical protein VEJ45_00200 [Candidatus Acidoferrales bacterium]|nr:hypothetical protein [Candidatus Acidoferrales bacterium]